MSMNHVPPPPGYPAHPGYGAPPGYPAPPGPPPASRGAVGRWSATIIVGLVAAASGFAEISFSSSRTVNGVVVECDYVNLAPWVFGPVALVCGLVGAVRARRPGATSGRERSLAVLCVTLGALHLLRAFGVLDLMSGSPC